MFRLSKNSLVKKILTHPPLAPTLTSRILEVKSFASTAKNPILISPSAKSWSLWRESAKQANPRKLRLITEYKQNYTASLASPPAAHSCEINPNANVLVKQYEDQISEHAARRVDLFFYTLIAYYATGFAPISGQTRLQHGKGNAACKTQAAHSSFITYPIDQTVVTKRFLFSTLTHDPTIEVSLLSKTAFLDSLNLTVELPGFINELDYEIEIRCKAREKSYTILREVAQNKLDPLQGLLRFLQLLKNIFSDLKKSGSIFQSNTKLHRKLKITILALEQKGTLINKLQQDGMALNDDYIYMLLRLKPEEIVTCKKDKIKKGIVLTRKIKRNSD